MIHSYEYCISKYKEIGHVTAIRGSIVEIIGLSKVGVGEGVAFETGEHGMVLSFDREKAEILVLSRISLKPHTKAVRTGSQLTVSCGEGILGHTLDAFGYAKDERRERSDFPEKRPIIIPAPGMSKRREVKEFMSTGVSVVDIMIPIGRGQRELIIGDRKTGKTQFLLQTVLAQSNLGKICILGLIGKKKEEVKKIEEFLKSYGVMEKCVIVAADSHDSSGEIFIAPYTAMTLAEYFRDKGADVLLILDDLTTHAKYYREVSLLGRRFPGRESYPGDVFYIQSSLLERAGNFAIDGISSSITCLPVAESQEGDITGYIQTNLMSMTDGHIYFDSGLFFKGVRPAVNVFMSVTRVGRQTQTPLARDIEGKVMSLLKKYEDLQRFLRFGPEISDEVQNILKLGDSVHRLFNQTEVQPILPNVQIILLSLIWLGLWNGKGALLFSKAYEIDPKLKNKIDTLINSTSTFDVLNNKLKFENSYLTEVFTGK